jgi:hypothetical protein
VSKLVTSGLWFFLSIASLGVRAQDTFCRTPTEFAGEPPVSAQPLRRPERILLVPLLKEYNERDERWPERPAAAIRNFYRSRFGAAVEWLQDIRNWKDYYRETDLLKKDRLVFDRVILIGHGGFDGPILKQWMLRNEVAITGSEGRAERVLESQPGLQDRFSITYDVSQNKAFSDFMIAHWEDLADKDAAAAREILTQQEIRLAAPDRACLRRLCANGRQPGSENAQNLSTAACESICRNPLFTSDSGQLLAPERFFKFAESLRSLTANNGIIILGMCNPGSRIPEKETPWDTTGILTRSGLANGPHENYAQLLSAGTGRTVAGPIGKTSAEDIVVRVKLFETGQPQRFLRIISPGPDCAASERLSDAD